MKLSVQERSALVTLLVDEVSQTLRKILKIVSDRDLDLALKSPNRRVKVDEAQRTLLRSLVTEAMIHFSVHSRAEDNSQSDGESMFVPDYKNLFGEPGLWKTEPSCELDEPSKAELEVDDGGSVTPKALEMSLEFVVSPLIGSPAVGPCNNFVVPDPELLADDDEKATLGSFSIGMSQDSQILLNVDKDEKYSKPLARRRLNRQHCRKRVEIQADSKRKQCDICGALVQDLPRHRNSHTGEKSYTCKFCGKAFTDPSVLIQHRKILHFEKKFVCHICGRKFGLKNKLTLHLNRHNNIKPYKCDICDKGFISGTKMRQHRRIHTGEKPHQCHVCQLKLSRRGYLNDHLRTQHSIVVKRDGKGRPGGTPLLDGVTRNDNIDS